MRGGEGDDTVSGGPGNDLIVSGDPGNDRVSGCAGNDLLRGGSGADTLNGGVGSYTCDGGTQVDVVVNCETVINVLESPEHTFNPSRLTGCNRKEVIYRSRMS